MAKLVPATCPKCGASVKLDPDREFVTCQFCGASSFIQTQKRAVTQYVQAHAMPVIHVRHAAGVLGGCSGAVAVVAGLLGVGGAVVGGVVAYMSSVTVDSVVSTPVGAAAAPQPAATTGPRVESKSALLEEDYYADATVAKGRYQKVLGKPIMAKQLVLMQYYATLEAQNPKNREHVDSYRLWANTVERPQPVQLGSQKQQLQKLLFSLDDVDFGLLPKILKQALTELKVEEGKIQVVTLNRDGPGQPPVWRVVVNGSRDNGMVEFSLSGEKLRTIQ